MPLAIGDWRAEHFRFSVFLSNPVADLASAWRVATAADPDIDEHRPKEGVRHQVGQFAGGTLDMNGSAARVDFVLVGPASEVPAPIQDVMVSLVTFNEAVANWLHSTAPNAVRVAFGAALLLPAATREEAYGQMGKLVDSLKIDPSRSKEVLYRVNHPVFSTTIRSLEINRMMTWSSVRFRTVLMTMPGAAALPALAEHHFLRLELDFNTSPERTEPLDSEGLTAIYDELVRSALNTATRGENA